MDTDVADEADDRLSKSCESAYLHRINRAIDHIMRNLDGGLTLDDVAKVACFSPFHFHRVFRAAVGETPHAFIKRTRLERALMLMAQPPRRQLTDIARQCGFSSSADFSRSFKAHFGVAARRFDLAAYQAERRAELVATTPGGEGLSRLPPEANPDGFRVRLRRLAPRRVAYVRAFQPYKGGVAIALTRLREWAQARGLEGGQWLGYQWEDPEIVPLDQCRYDVGLEVPEDVPLDGGVNEARFTEMTVAEVAIAGDISLELRALWWLYGSWLPRSGYTPAHQPCFEAWNGLPFAHGMDHFDLRVHLAVERI